MIRYILFVISIFTLYANDIEIHHNIDINLEKELSIKKLLPYRHIDNRCCKVMGNIVKYRDIDGKMHIMRYDDLEDRYNRINNMIDQYIEALKRYRDNNGTKKDFDNCSTLVSYYPNNQFTCFRLMKKLSEEEKSRLSEFVEYFLKVEK